MTRLPICYHGIRLAPQSNRVIIRPFIPDSPQRISAVGDRVLAMTEAEVVRDLELVYQAFEVRHLNLERAFLAHYHQGFPDLGTHPLISLARKLLIGAAFSGEYALESAALFNPSIVPHPDQTDVPEGGLRFVMSLRATGEGHVSSIEFRAGLISPDGTICLDPTSKFITAPEKIGGPFPPDPDYELTFPSQLAMSERIIFPSSPEEQNGMEDARFVQFIDDDGEVTYYATYTAYDGRTTLPKLIQTKDFCQFSIRTLSGNAIHDKGMALFPRRVNGLYMMLSRQDYENISIMVSEDVMHWNNPQVILRPAEVWELVKIGNCGSPIETEAGWLVITHGVGPMRKYCLGAALLDLNDPTQVLGRLRTPFLCPEDTEQDGYVPNVVYSCGSMRHGNTLILPYAKNDTITEITTINLDSLIGELLR